MKCPKLISDSVRKALIKASTSTFQTMETRLENSGKFKKAQKLRKLQHDFFGLTEDQWLYITDYFESEHILHLASQGHEKVQRWYNELINEPPANDPIKINRRKKREAYYKEGLDLYQDHIHAVEGIINLLEIKMGHTPLYRAMVSHRRYSDWYLSNWLRERCSVNGGCCGRSCGCCEKPRDTTKSRWCFGHCTPTCDCCVRYKDRGLEITVRNSAHPSLPLLPRNTKEYLHIKLKYEGHVTFNPRKEKTDITSARLMDAYVWGLNV